MDKYGLYSATYYYWKRKYAIYGEEVLKQKTSKDQICQIKKLKKENEQLKIIFVEKEIEKLE